MSAASKLVNAIYWLALTVWVSVLISAGVAAMSAFTALPDEELGLRLEQFAAYDASRHGQIAAGKVMEPIFTFVDLMQLVAGGLVIITLLAQMTLFGMSWRRPANLIRAVCILLAIGLFLFRAVAITPGMNQDLRAYWQHAQAGEVEPARARQQSFEAAHRRARPLFDASLLVLLIGVGASAAAFTAVDPSRASDREPVNLERPALVRRSR
jgi:hypothetical protein